MTTKTKTTTTTTNATRATRARKSRANDDATFTLVQLARELNIDPKTIRARARKYASRLPKWVAKHVYRERDRANVVAIVVPKSHA